MKVRLSMLMLCTAALLSVTGCLKSGHYNLPPAERIMHPGPGTGGPGPGVITPDYPVVPAQAMMGMDGMPGNCMDGMGMGMAGPMTGHMMGMGQAVSQVLFSKPEMMQVRWDVGGVGTYDSAPLICPGRQNFPQGGIYRLKVTNVAGREGVELYPTMEIGPATPRTESFLAHSAIPVQFTEEDFDQVLTGNLVTKVIYLPDREHQELAVAGVETLVSTRLDPNIDPIVEADRRGSILAIIRLGNIDPELPGMDTMSDASVIRANYQDGTAPVPMGPAMGGMQGPAIPGTPVPMGMPPGYVAGVTAPQYGMPQTGTPIGLVGAPHIPFGAPAGLNRHVMVDHTRKHIPGPTNKLRMDVKQTPGLSYPKPSNHMILTDRSHGASLNFRQPHRDKRYCVDASEGEGCE